MPLFECLRRTALLIVASFGLCAAAFGASDPLDVQFLVNTDWVKQNGSNPRVRLLDVRAADDYRVGHIEGAVNLPIDRLFVNDNGKRYIGPLAQIQKAFSEAGIGDDTLAVVYDAGEFLPSSRAFWVFEVYGHTRVVVLDGGFAAWMQQKLPVSMQDVVVQPREFVPTVTPNRLATKLTTRFAVDRPSTVIVDARSPADFRGEKSIAQRFGHIPSAINVPVMEHFDEMNGVKHLKPVEQLRAFYNAIDPGKKVVTYCNTGILSSTTYFELRRLGYDVSNYDGSWVEWGNDTALPIVAPAAGTPTVKSGGGM